MIRFVVRRLCFICFVLLISSALIFTATQVLPGDVAKMILGRFASDEALNNLREQLGLNRPLIEQYSSWLFNFIRGDWGISLSTNQRVGDIILGRLVNSLRLAAVAFAIFVPGGILLGLLAALKRNKIVDQVISIGSMSLIGIPEFVTGVILISIFSIKLGWLPSSSAISPNSGFIESFRYLILPSVTVSMVSLAYIIRMTRASTIEVMFTDYVRTAYLKGLKPASVLFRHVLRNSLLPTVTVVANQFGWLISGLIVTESLFSYPGLGRMLLFGIQRQDIPLVQASTMILVAIYCISNLMADILYAFLNPQIRYR